VYTHSPLPGLPLPLYHPWNWPPGMRSWSASAPAYRSLPSTQPTFDLSLLVFLLQSSPRDISTPQIPDADALRVWSCRCVDHHRHYPLMVTVDRSVHTEATHAESLQCVVCHPLCPWRRCDRVCLVRALSPTSAHHLAHVCLWHAQAPATYLETHTTYVNTNNSRDPAPDTGHEETTTATTRRQ
jgi:hypothetical protein